MIIIDLSIVENLVKNVEDVSWFFFDGGGLFRVINLRFLEVDVICKFKCLNVENLVWIFCFILKFL